jgi:hypothetical protein
MTKTQSIFNKAILKYAEIVKMINEDGVDADSKELEKANEELSQFEMQLQDLPFDFGDYDKEDDYYYIKDLNKYIKGVVGSNYFFDKRCWSYLYDIIYEVEGNIGWSL